MLHALGALMPGPAGPAPGGHPVLQPPPAPNGAALAPAAGDALAAAIALINNPAQLLVRFPFQGDTDMEDATYWTGVAMNSTAATMEYTLRWGCVCPWTATDADIKGDWGLSARQFICAVGYHDAQDLGLNDDGLPTNKVVWHTTRERVAGFCTTGKIYKWLAAPPPLVAKQAPRPAWLAGKPPGPQEDTRRATSTSSRWWSSALHAATYSKAGRAHLCCGRGWPSTPLKEQRAVFTAVPQPKW